MAEQAQLWKDSRIRRLIENPAYIVVTGIATVITIIGLPLSFYFFLAGRATPNLTFYVSPTRTAIVTVRDEQNLSVSYAGRQIHGDISSAQVTIWNTGKRPITHSDVLTTLSLAFPAHNAILDAKVLNVSRPLIDFKLGTDGAANGVLTLDWRILEYNDGVRLQVIYAGDTNAEIVVNGAIIGQRAPSNRVVVHGGRAPIWVEICLIPMMIFIIFVSTRFFGSLIRESQVRRQVIYGGARSEWVYKLYSIGFSILLLGSIGFLALFTYEAIYSNYLIVPPFGF